MARDATMSCAGARHASPWFATGRACPAPARSTIRNTGFTLIEVLAALAIIGLGMLAAIQAVTQTVNNASYLRDKTIAGWVALNKIEDVRLASQQPSAEKTSGVVTMASREWRWSMNITATDVPDMLRIDVSVAPAEADKDSSLVTASGFYGRAITSTGANMPWDGSGISNSSSSSSSR